MTDCKQAYLDMAAENLEKSDIEYLIGEVNEAYRLKELQAAKYAQIKPQVDARWLKGLVAQDDTITSTRMGMENLMESIKRGAQAELRDLIMVSKAKLAGIRKPHEVHEGIIRAIYGEANDYSSMAGAWITTMSRLTHRAYEAGSNMNPSMILPQRWNSQAVSKAEPATFIQDILDRVDYEQMGLTRRQLEPAMDDYYKFITSGGIHKPYIDASTRITKEFYEGQTPFIFKTADDYIEIQKLYSNPNTFSAMGDTLTNLSREIASLETLGPYPRQMLNAIQKDNPNLSMRNVIGQYDQYAATNIPVDGWLGTTGANIRNFEVATKLGTAPLTALTDIWFSKMTARFNGLPAIKTFGHLLANLSKNKDDLAKQGMDLYLGAEHLLDNTRTAARWADVSGDMAGTFIGDQAADALIRGSGLNLWTAVSKQTFGEMWLLQLGQGKFNERNLQAFKRFGITDADLDVLAKSTKIHGKYADLSQISDKFAGMIAAETKMAVPEAGIRTRAALNQGTTPGTAGGEGMRAVSLFKTFPMHIATSYFPRYYVGRSNTQRIAAMGDLIVGLTVIGAMVVQAKEMIKGREPMDMDNSKFWGRAFAQGGAGGIIGDFIFQDYNRYGVSVANMIGGPIAGDATDIGKNSSKLINAMLSSSKKDMEKALSGIAINTAKGINPFDSLWYTKLANDRAINNSILKATNSNWKSQWRKSERARVKRGGGKTYNWAKP